MQHPGFRWLALAGWFLLSPPATGAVQHFEDPLWTEPEARSLAASPAVDRAIESLLQLTLAGADAPGLIDAIDRLRRDEALTPPERDAVLYGYVRRLRGFPPGTVPGAVLDRLAGAAPLAVTGHEEGPHHAVPLFNVAAAARGLANEWAWRRGHAAIAGPDPIALSTLAEELAGSTLDQPRFRGMRLAIERLPATRLDELSRLCAAHPAGCGIARADIELARGNVAWLKRWVAVASPENLTPRLQALRRRMPPSDATAIMQAALRHPDAGVVARAMSDITSHLPKEASARKAWGIRLVDLLDEPDLGAAAALQLARLGSEDWLEAALSRPLGEKALRRIELLAELENALQAQQAEGGGGR